jgi:hypothetical protein
MIYTVLESACPCDATFVRLSWAPITDRALRQLVPSSVRRYDEWYVRAPRRNIPKTAGVPREPEWRPAP